MACINPSDPRFQEILQRVENPLLAEIEYERYLNSDAPQVSYYLKAVEILASPKAKEVFKKGEKNNWTLDKILTELQVPKNQKQMIINAYNANLFEAEGQLIEPTINDLITHLLSANSFTVEINTALGKSGAMNAYEGGEGAFAMGYSVFKDFEYNGDKYTQVNELEFDGEYHHYYKKNGKKITKSEFEEFAKKKREESKLVPTDYYASLTVPGGTNYTENEIKTPDITPSIKGHAQFATDKGIGWFRSDEQEIQQKRVMSFERTYDEYGNEISYKEFGEVGKQGTGEATKNRRILEVQSDLFQKGRDLYNLVQNTDYLHVTEKRDYSTGDKYYTVPKNNSLSSELEVFNSKKEAEDYINNIKSKTQTSSENQFLQLLNKNSNWVTFFIKSIIQDSAKKGYEKVLFPTGNTASKVEGHTTLEEFKKEKEDRIKELENKIEGGKWLIKNRSVSGFDKNSQDIINKSFKFLKDQNLSDAIYKAKKEEIDNELNKIVINAEREINRLKQELERVEGPEGFGALKPIYNFYENTVTNILNKNGYNPIKVTDEYGNTWNEVELSEKRDMSPIFLQKRGTEMAPASPKAIAMIKDFTKRIGVDIKSLEEINANGTKYDGNGVALLMQKLIGVADGKESSSLPEEAMHFAVAIIKQTNPTLYKKLLSEINSYNTLKQVFADYGNDPNYQTPDGKPDIIKLKEEAIGKVLAETIINQAENTEESNERLAKVQSWWDQILDWLKNLFFTKSGFDQASMDIISGKEIGTADDIREGETQAFLQKDAQSIVYDNLIHTSQKIGKPKLDEEGQERYYIDGKKIKNRPSDLQQDYYKRKNQNNELLDSDYEKAVQDLKKEKGTAGHSDMEHAFTLFIDENGFVRDVPLDDSGYVSQINPNSNVMYNTLKENLQQRINSFPKGTRFLAEVVIYNPKRDIAGSADFVAIEPDAKINILDWKFMNLNTEKYGDIPWYKVESWRIQMNQYKYILQNAYGVQSQDFNQTRMIPILANYAPGKPKQFEEKGQAVLPKLISIKIGDVNVKNIEEDYLVPVALETEKTGNKKLDNLIAKLNVAYEKLSKITVTPEQRENKRDQLNSLFSAIRHLQMQQDVQPLIKQAKILSKQVKLIIEEYNNKFKGKDPKQFTDAEISKFAEELDTTQFAMSNYVDLYNDLRQIVGDDPEMKEDLRNISDDARDFQNDLDDVLNEFTSEIIVKGEGLSGFLSPEKTIKGIAKWFSSTATLQTKAIQALYRKANKAFSFAAMSNQEEISRLETLRTSYQDWAKANGFTGKRLFDIIKKKGSNKLIDEFKPEFYNELKKNIAEKDNKWIRDNVDKTAYIKHIKEVLQKELDRIENKPRLDDETSAKDKAREIQRAKDLHDVSTTESLGWLLYNEVKKFPNRETWESEEWKLLTKAGNESAKKFYDYIIEKNNEYAELGYINKLQARIFLPYVRKSFTEKLVTGGNPEIGKEFLESISVDEGTVGFGQIDPLTGKVINTIPKYFTTELDEEVSDDLFRTMALYNEAALRYKYLRDIEAQVRAIIKVEKNKESIATSIFGKAERKDGQIVYNPDNRANSELAEDMMKAIIYGQRYVESQTFDSVLMKVGTWGKTFNEKLGIKVFPEDLSERQITVNRAVDSLNNTFQITTLGLNVLSSTSNFFGGNVQSIINSGKYFTKTDFIKAETQFFINKFNGEDQKKFVAALHYFLPFTDNYNRELTKDLSVHNFTQESFQDFLMVLMRKGDQAVQAANFYAYLDNSIVMEGKVVNAREYLRSLPEYSNKYSGSVEDRKAFDLKFEERVKKLIAEKGVMKLAEIKNNQLVIPGVERLSDSVVELRRKVQQLTKDAVGNLSEDDLRSINMTIFGKSFMVFKNWIPRLVDIRLGGLKYNSASDAYEWGRMRTIFSMLTEGYFSNLENIMSLLTGGDKAMELMRKTYEKRKAEYEEETGHELNMSEELFIDMIRQNLQASIYDAVITASLMISVLSLKLNPPDEEENPAVINQYRFAVRALDKLTDELLYFYNPTSLTGLVSSGLFPSMSLITNGSKAIKNFFKEMYGLGIGDEELVKDTKVIKYTMKSFPFTNQVVGYLPMFYPELAKDLGIRVQSNYGMR